MMTNIIEQLPGYIAWKDTNHNYLGCNRNLAALYGFTHTSEIIGMKDKDLRVESQELLDFYHDCDNLALKGKTVKLIHDSDDTNKSYLLEKKALLSETNSIIGTIFQCQELKQNILVNIKKHDKYHHPLLKSYKVDFQKNPYHLSTRELECLFCLLRSMTAKRIAEVLRLSVRTIEFYIANIKNKFGCLNKSELIILSIQQGYMDVIPPRFVNYHLTQLFS